MQDDIFTIPEGPFLLTSEDAEHNKSINWFETEEELLQFSAKIKKADGKIIGAIGFGGAFPVFVM